MMHKINPIEHNHALRVPSRARTGFNVACVRQLCRMSTPGWRRQSVSPSVLKPLIQLIDNLRVLAFVDNILVHVGVNCQVVELVALTVVPQWNAPVS